MRAVTEFLNDKISKGLFAGASVSFAKDGFEIVNVQAGTLSREVAASVNSQTAFDLQSITKAIGTALVFYRLEQDSSLKLGDTIDAYLPPMAPRTLAGRGITFKHLLNHASGLSDSSAEGSFRTTYDFWLKLFSSDLQFAPDSSIEYTDVGYRILGKILESRAGESLETLTSRIYEDMGLAGEVSYFPSDVFNIAGTPDQHGLIDDEQVRKLGSVVGCDGLFGSSSGIQKILMALSYSTEGEFKDFASWLETNTKVGVPSLSSYFDTLAVGSKAPGWELNPRGLSYSGKFKSDSVFEKAGGAGTFVWFDAKTRTSLVYLTNYGKPKPFTEESWNKLVNDIDPAGLSNVIYDNI